MAALYIIATPIGNLKDITLRALEKLRQVELIAAEDTRVTSRLLADYNISTPLVSYHSHNAHTREPELLQHLRDGRDIGLVSDAGTPLISDPGFALVRRAIEDAITVIPIPGASSLITALCASGLRTDRFVFEGFLPQKKGARNARLKQLKYEFGTIVLFESKHRLRNLLEELRDTMGSSRRLVVGKELTKLHERFLRGTVEDLTSMLDESSELGKGEFVVMIEGCSDQDSDQLERAHTLLKAISAHMSHRDAVSLAAQTLNLHKNELYSLAQVYYPKS